MRKFTSLAAASALATLSTVSLAQPVQEQSGSKNESSDESGEKEEQKADDNKKICKRIQSMGSRFSKKVCMTKAQWDAQREGAQDAARDER